MKIIFSFALCCLALLLLFSAFGILSSGFGPNIQALLTSPIGGPAALHLPITQAPQTATLLFVGDIMLDRGVEFEIKKNGGDWTWPFHRIADAFSEADLAFGNLESQISDKGENVGSMYSLRADPRSIEGLVYTGFDVLSVANNHSFDYGKEAFEDSLSRLKAAGIAPVGGGLSREEAEGLVIREVRGTKVGFLAYANSGSPAWAATEQSSSIAWADLKTLPDILQDIGKAKKLADILVVSLHAGEEYAPEPNEFQRRFSQGGIEAGADLVVGHHSHVVQPLVPHARKDGSHGWIAYGLGNFMFDQNISEETMRGAILKMLVENKKIKEISLLPTRLTSSFQVQIEE